MMNRPQMPNAKSLISVFEAASTRLFVNLVVVLRSTRFYHVLSMRSFVVRDIRVFGVFDLVQTPRVALPHDGSPSKRSFR